MKEIVYNKKDMRDMKEAIVGTICDLIKKDDKVVALDADLASASGFSKIEEMHPENFIQCGIAEANMVGVACGMSLLGYKPFIHTFAPFASRRIFDQVFLSGGYANCDINVFGSDPGFCVGPNGGTHTSFEDIALYKMIPNSIICDPADYNQFKFVVNEFYKTTGVKYVRASRKPVFDIYSDDYKFEMGKGNLLQEGSDVLIISAGQVLSEVLNAVEMIKGKISCSVIDMFCIKPLDIDLIIKESANKKLIVTVENHSIHNGLGSSVADVIACNNLGVKLVKMGVDEEFGQVGTPDYLQEYFKLKSSDIVKVIIDETK